MTYNDALARFIEQLKIRDKEYNAKMNFNWQTNFEVMSGRINDKIVKIAHNRRSSYCYIEKSTGGIMKGSWKRVEDHRHRGNIYNENPLEGTNEYGTMYMTELKGKII